MHRALALSLAVALSLVSGRALAQVEESAEAPRGLHAADVDANALERPARTERDEGLTEDARVAPREARTDVSPAVEHGSDAWPWVALAGAILVVGAIIATAAIAASGVDTTVEGPTIAELRF